jgi:putative addiction module component (TIGR02574 family)
MTMQAQALFDAILALPEEEQELLVERLLERFSPQAEELDDERLYAELERRSAEIEDGSVKPVPWSEVRLEE